MKRTLPILLLALTVISLFNGCATIRELQAFAKCDFRIKNVRNTQVCNVNIQEKRSYKDLNMMDAAKVAGALVQKSMPLEFTLNVDVRNPNEELAAMNRLEWIALVDGIEIAQGNVDQRVEIPPNNGVATLPIRISNDIWQMIKNKDRDGKLDFPFKIADRNGKPLKVQLKVKPTIRIGKVPITYPGYITVGHAFTSGGKRS